MSALEVGVERERYAPGETVRGSVIVAQGGGAGEIRVSLNFHERSGEFEAVTMSLPGGTLHSGELVTGSAHRFAIELPEDALPSYTAKHGALWWAVDVTADESDSNVVASRGIEVSAPPATP